MIFNRREIFLFSIVASLIVYIFIDHSIRFFEPSALTQIDNSNAAKVSAVWTKVLGLTGILSLIVTLITVIFLYLNFVSMDKQIRILEEERRFIDKPKIRISDLILYIIDHINFPLFSLRISNHGRSASPLVMVHVELVFSNGEDELTLSEISDCFSVPETGLAENFETVIQLSPTGSSLIKFTEHHFGQIFGHVTVYWQISDSDFAIERVSVFWKNVLREGFEGDHFGREIFFRIMNRELSRVSERPSVFTTKPSEG